MSGLLLVRELRLSLGTREILRGVDLEVSAGEVCALMGISGAGKTSVLRSIAALQRFESGSIAVNGFRLAPGPLPRESRLRPLRRSVGMVFQAHSLFEHLTVIENVGLAPVHALGWAPERAGDLAHKLLASLGVAARADAFPRQLSGGEAQRVAIARVLALDPVVVLMDEPTSALDPARRAALGSTLRALAREGRGLLIATHDVEFAGAHADRVAILASGVVVEQGRPDEVLTRPSHEATRELLRTPEAATEATEAVRPWSIHGKEHM
ncbi:MAG: amino acid ABC transporter ATP-binding protein [Gemmatimonadetes bacterium]|nr:amino acid ABC transporter ATP-binding protein [Gemmatimonadota bacterium]